ncbi:DNA repair protein RecO (recombination protein O) [Peptoniphilus olsenii]|uniref:DNA repair protein RecO n=1 Tax=Peptoniphilus olsenii TaxID=411570 RepID=A0ABV2J935_9FIRM
MDTIKDFTLGIVLNDMDFGETSKIIRVFTRDYGKLSVMVKGAKTNKSKNLAVSQVFGLNEYLFRKGQSFYYINNAKIIESNFKIRENLENTIYASLALELIDKSTIERDPNIKVFDLLNKTLNLFNGSLDPLSLIISFEIKYLSFLGYRPKLRIYDYNYFSIREGIIDYRDEYSFEVTREDIAYLDFLLHNTLDSEYNYGINRKFFLHNIIIKYIKYNLEISNFNSLKLLS